jgi:hypothetical protein
LFAQLQVLLPLHPGLGRLLMSRQVAIRVLEQRADFLQRIEAAGMGQGKSCHFVDPGCCCLTIHR